MDNTFATFKFMPACNFGTHAVKTGSYPSVDENDNPIIDADGNVQFDTYYKDEDSKYYVDAMMVVQTETRTDVYTTDPYGKIQMQHKVFKRQPQYSEGHWQSKVAMPVYWYATEHEYQTYVDYVSNKPFYRKIATFNNKET